MRLPKEDQIKELKRELADMVRQHCDADSDHKYCSGYIRTNADAMRILADLDKMTILTDDGGRFVIAKFKEE